MGILQEISLIQWILLGITIFVLTSFAVLINLRHKKSHSKKKVRMWAEINKERGTGSLQPNESEKNLDWLKGELHFGTKKSWSVAIIVVGVILWYKMSDTKIDLADVSSWSKEYWLQILIVYGIGAGLIWLNADEKSAKVLQKVLAGLTATVLVVLPMWSWISSPSNATPAAQSSQRSGIPLANVLPRDAPDVPRAWKTDGSMTDTSTWPRVQIPPYGNSAHVPGIFDGHVVWGGSGFTIHCVYTDGHEGIVGDMNRPCNDGNIISSYVRNEGGTVLYASYAYAKRGEK